MLFCLCWLALLVAVGIAGQSVTSKSPDKPQLRKYSDECRNESTRKRIKICLNRGQVVHMPTFRCFEVNSQGGCDAGETIVVEKTSECMATKCLQYKSKDGKPCSKGLFAYKGKCEISGSKFLCLGSGLGKRLLADLYGTVACRCAVDLGYVDVNGRCYHEYFRGPCQEGEQIIRDGVQGWKCVGHRPR